VEIFGPLLIFNYNVSKWFSVYIVIFEDIVALIILSQRKVSFFSCSLY
jgi:hypothetical protein